MIINYTIELTYFIKGYNNYAFGKDKNLYNLKTNRRLKQSLNNGTIGYWFSKKFISLKSLKILLYKKKNTKLPF
jgi:hypothetical protein